MKYAVKWTNRKGATEEQNEIVSFGAALEIANSKKASSKVVVVLQAIEAQDVEPNKYHPDNVGKYFLHQIIK